MMGYIKAILLLIRDAAADYMRDRAAMLAAGLAYYTVFSMAPLLLLSVAVAGFFFGEAAVRGELVARLEGSIGPEVAAFIQNLLASTRGSPAGVPATLISTALLFFGASGVFNNLKVALNTIWGIRRAHDDRLEGVLALLKGRVLSLAMVLGIGFLLLLATGIDTVLSILDEYLIESWSGFEYAIVLLDYTVSLIIPILLFAFIFRVLPDASVAWRDVWLGAVVTALLFGLGVNIINWYLGRSGIGSAYGAAGSLIIILLWIYYSAQILLFGAEFTQVYAERHGSRIVPDESTVEISYVPASETPEAPSIDRRPIAGPPPAPVPPSPWRGQAAAGLLGLALGLLVAFVSGWWRER